MHGRGMDSTVKDLPGFEKTLISRHPPAEREKNTELNSHIKKCILMCGGDDVMATNLAIDDQLIEMARTVGKHSTKKAAVTEALKEYIRKRKQLGITKLFGKVGYEKDYDYKKQRKRV
jgi:hypothetical protein